VRALVLMLLILFSPLAGACKCVDYAIEALSFANIRLATIPSIAVNDWFKHVGSYSQGVVNIANINDCHTMLHEFVHHWQWLHHGNAKDLNEWRAREMQAAMMTMNLEAEKGPCV
jgi:hypothetical protein